MRRSSAPLACVQEYVPKKPLAILLVAVSTIPWHIWFEELVAVIAENLESTIHEPSRDHLYFGHERERETEGHGQRYEEGNSCERIVP